MGEANGASGAHGAMDVHEHRATFAAFIKATEWGSLHVAAIVALLTVAFAIGAGWFAGVAAFAAIVGLGGLILRLGPAWWVANGALLVLMLVGGGAVALISGLSS